jgi:beta-phosphoglucomutase-like phosphatase (HAD superfamily)
MGTSQLLGEQRLKEGFQEKVDHAAFGRLWSSTYIEATSYSPIPLKSGVNELIAELKRYRVLLAVATSTPTSLATKKLQGSGILSCFDLVIGGDQVQRSKPHPDIFFKTAELLHVKPERCLVIEDSTNGVKAALAARMMVIQVPDLVEPSAEMRKAGHAILSSLHDVRTWYIGLRSADAPPKTPASDSS